MKRAIPGILMLLTVMVWQGASRAQLRGAAVSGIVRDAHGTPQVGALVELMTGEATSVAAAFTDTHGRYVLPSLLPGKYRLRASAAFFMPAMQGELRLRPGSQAVINLTMSTLFEAADWLPAQPRHPDEPADDWKWTLRSTASRPLLRLVDPDTGEEISSSQIASNQAEGVHKPSSQMRLAIINGDGAFGSGGVHQVFTLARTAEAADTAVFRVETGDMQAALPVRPSAEITAGYETRGSFGRTTRVLASFQSHPELLSAGAGEASIVRLASTQQMSLGDAVMVDVGTLLRAERLVSSRVLAEPFLRVSLRADDRTVLGLRYAAGRSVQSSGDLDRLKPALEIMSDSAGRPVSDAGHHTEISLDRKLGQRTLTAALYADDISNTALTGSGQLHASPLVPLAVITDTSTGTFRVATKGLTSEGLSVALAQPLSKGLTARVEYDLGKALVSSGETLTLVGLNGQLRSRTENSANVAIRGRIYRSGTTMDAEYRWQPLGTLTQVNAFNARPDHAYLSFFLRQRLWCGRFLPEGLDAVIEATNLLEQGYQPVLSPDGGTLFLAQAPRGVQGGLAFNF